MLFKPQTFSKVGLDFAILATSDEILCCGL